MSDNVISMQRGGFSFGDAGEVSEVDYVSVTYFGTPLRVLGSSDDLEIALQEFMEMAMTIDEDDPAATVAVRGLVRAILHPDDFDSYWATVKKHRQGINKQMEFAKAVMESVTGTPIDALSDSSGGQPTTPANSEDDVSYRAQRRLEESGRPDLAYAVLLRREALSG